MPDPKTQLVTFSLALGIDNVSSEENVQPVGQRPRLVRSRNTRLTKKPGMATKAPGCVQIESGNVVEPEPFEDPCGGVIPSGDRDSSLVVFDPDTRSRRVAGQDVARSNGIHTFGDTKSAYYPAQVLSAGTVPGVQRSYYSSATCYVASTGQTWFAAMVTATSTTCAVAVTVIDDAGRLVVAQTFASPGITGQAFDPSFFLGLSSHGETVLLWVGSPTPGIEARLLTITPDLQLEDTPWTFVYKPIASTALWRTQLAYDPNDIGSVYLACQNSAVAKDVTVLRITPTTLAITATYTRVTTAPPDSTGLAYRAGDAVLLATAVGTAWELVELSPALVLVGASTVAGASTAIVSCGFQSFDQEDPPGAAFRVLAASRTSTTLNGTFVAIKRPTTLSTLHEGYIPHQTMIGQIVTVTLSPTKIHAILTTQVCYQANNNANTYDPTVESTFVFDPSIDVLRLHVGSSFIGGGGGAALLSYSVARLGSDLAILYPGVLTIAERQFITSSRSAIAHGSRMLVTYLAENTLEGATLQGYQSRYAWLEFGNVQPAFAATGTGATVVAGALPAVWDGSQITELSPLRDPKILSSTLTGGLGAAFPAGTYLFAAVISFKDAQGQLHRSAPSNTVTLVNPTQPTLTVASPITHRNGVTQERYTITIYMSEANGVVLYAQPNALSIFGSTGLTWVFNNLNPPEVDAYHPAIYTDESATQPLAAFMPNACLDADVIANRLWLLDAERPLRWYYSKPREVGVFFEMNPDLYVDVPANAGQGVATANLRETPLFLCSNGVWTVSGEGPDALLNPPEYSAPQQLSDTPCTQRLSVVKTPVGVMFVSTDRFVLFQGAVKEFDDVDAALHGPVIGTAVFRAQQEVVFFCADGFCYVYNWSADAWTEWDTSVTGVTSITAVAQVPTSGCVLYYGDGGELWRMDPSTVSETAQIDILTGHVTFGGVQDDQVIANVLLHARRAGAHGLEVKTATDYRGTPDTTKAYSALEIASAVDDATTSKRFALFAEPAVQPARAVQFQFTEVGAEGEAFQPIHCTVELRKNGGKLMQAMRTAARK